MQFVRPKAVVEIFHSGNLISTPVSGSSLILTIGTLRQFTNGSYRAGKIKIGEVLLYAYQFTTLTCGSRPCAGSRGGIFDCLLRPKAVIETGVKSASLSF